MDILDLKKQSGNRLNNLQEKFKGTTYEKDERFWTLTYDKTTKVGAATIRFIGPAKNSKGEVEPLEYQKFHTHSFKKNNKFYIENCPTTIGRKCPVCESNGELWKADKNNYPKDRSRKTNYIMNILVVKDPAKPDNEGKVFLYRCPKTIFDKIQGQIQPQYEGETPVNVFDMWSGANFKMRTCNKGEFLNYENSSFESPSPIFEDVNNSALYDTLWNKLYPLEEFTSEKLFKPYDELENKFLDVIKGVSTSYKENLANHEKVINKQETVSDDVPWTDAVENTKEEVSVATEDEFFKDLA